jgi:hypothetical protein
MEITDALHEDVPTFMITYFWVLKWPWLTMLTDIITVDFVVNMLPSLQMLRCLTYLPLSIACSGFVFHCADIFNL